MMGCEGYIDGTERPAPEIGSQGGPSKPCPLGLCEGAGLPRLVV